MLLIIGLTGHLNAWRQMINLVHKRQVYQSGCCAAPLPTNGWLWGEVVLTALKNGKALTITVPKVLFTSQQAVSGIVFKQFLFLHILP